MSLEYYVENGEGEIYNHRYPDRLAVDYVTNAEPKMTREEFADDCDINQIMARYEKAGGQWPPPPVGVEPRYYDFTSVPSDLQSAMAVMLEADSAFMRLPASVRKEFDNDPARFVQFASEGENLEQMRKWGLAEPVKGPDKPVRVEVVSPPLAPGAAPEASPRAATHVTP